MMRRLSPRAARRLWLGGCLACGAAVGGGAWLRPAPALGKPGVVQTTDGRSIEGDVNVDKPESVTITVRGGQTTLARDQVASITYVAGVDEEYKKRLAKLPPGADAKGHVELARWLFDNKAYEQSRIELDTARRINPGEADLDALSRTVESQLHLERTKPAGAGTPPPRPPNATGGPKPPHPAGTEHTAAERKYLSPEDVNVIRQTEWRQNDATVKAQLMGDVRKRYMQFATVSPAEFQAMSSTQQAMEVLSHGQPEMRKDVKITNDPAGLAEYRRTIQPIVLSGCAAVGCHGGREGGNLFLYPSPENEAAAYTNFYLLQKYRAKVDKTTLLMIDRSYPDESLLAQYGLAEAVSPVKHPQVPRGVPWRGVFSSKEDPRYKQIINWMGKSLVVPEPNYGITFSLDAAAPRTPAATQPGKGKSNAE